MSVETMPIAEKITEKALLRFITCGSVDDGKSTLIGRLLHDSKLIFDDQLANLARASKKHGTQGEKIDFALLVDGLEAEREQGITIDVAYRFFATPARGFIVADTPGHEQFTRNMATGASTADLAIILVDASKGILTQTRRHSIICSLLGIKRIVLAVNKMDLVKFDEAIFNNIVTAYGDVAAELGFKNITFIPVSARDGDNVTTKSDKSPWYHGPTLLEHLEQVELSPNSGADFRFPVQWVNRPHAMFRGFAGTIASGAIKVGDQITVASSGRSAKIAEIVTFDGKLDSASAGQAVTLVLDAEIDIARGDLLSKPDKRPILSDNFAANLVWMGEEPLLVGRSYLMQIGTKSVPVRIGQIDYRLDVNSFERHQATSLGLNDIGLCQLTTSAPIGFDPYKINKRTGAFILIDRETNATIAAGMIEKSLRSAGHIFKQSHEIGRQERARLKHQKPLLVWFTGLSGAGKSTIANLVERGLFERGFHTMALDGDDVRLGLCKDLGFSEQDRSENLRRVGEAAKLMVDAGLVVLASFISPFASNRAMVRDMFDEASFLEVFVDVPLEVCMRRDPKGLYAKAITGEIRNFTGLGSPYERPISPEITIDGLNESAQDAANRIISAIIGFDPEVDSGGGI